jgi:hypothetical protein
LHRRGGISQKQEQGKRIYKYQELTKSCQRSLIEAEQMLSDAKSLGFYEKVLPYIQQAQRTSSYGYSILTSADLREKITLFLKTPDVKFAKRFRFGMHSMLRDFYCIVAGAKNRLSLRRKTLTVDDNRKL